VELSCVHRVVSFASQVSEGFMHHKAIASPFSYIHVSLIGVFPEIKLLSGLLQQV